jgi:hypothetical protein
MLVKFTRKMVTKRAKLTLLSRHSAISASGKDHGWSIDDWELIGAAGL